MAFAELSISSVKAIGLRTIHELVGSGMERGGRSFGISFERGSSVRLMVFPAMRVRRTLASYLAK